MLLTTIWLVVFVYTLLILSSLLMPKLLRVQKKDTGIYRTMTLFSNIGYMGFPLLRAGYGAECLIYASLFLIPFNLLIYTFGMSQFRENDGSREQGKRKFHLGSIINAGTVSCIITLWVSFAKPVFPMFISSAVDYLGALPTSLSMIVIGASLTEIPLKELFTDRRLLAFSALKLLVIPIAGLMAVRPFVKQQDLLAIVMVMLATPVASMVVMIAQQHNADYRTAAKGLSLTTLLSVVTIPLVSLIMGI
jgi:predicted permease